MTNKHTHYEKCDSTNMTIYPQFFEKLNSIQNIVGTHSIAHIDIDYHDHAYNTHCEDCNIHNYYVLSNIIWLDNIKHLITKHQRYPSQYFINIIMHTFYIKKYIVNPPIIVESILNMYYVLLHYNKSLIIDALMKQGSVKRYLGNHKYLYSEHSGVIVLKNRIIKNIIVSAETDRTDTADDSIFLPINTMDLQNHEYIFHTHPNATVYAGRINEGVLYEFPSASDIMNFVEFHDNGKAQASLIVCPEGIYVIRQLTHANKTYLPDNFYYNLAQFILKLEKKAVRKYISKSQSLHNENVFNETVSQDIEFIKLYNNFIEPYNLFVEYYPRTKLNDEWCLPIIYLQNITSN